MLTDSIKARKRSVNAHHSGERGVNIERCSSVIALKCSVQATKADDIARERMACGVTFSEQLSAVQELF